MLLPQGPNHGRGSAQKAALRQPSGHEGEPNREEDDLEQRAYDADDDRGTS